MENNLMLIGLGPHAKKIYLNFIKIHNLKLKLVVDLDSNSENILNILKEEKLENGETRVVLKLKPFLAPYKVSVALPMVNTPSLRPIIPPTSYVAYEELISP